MKATFDKDFSNRTMTTTRDFDAPKSRVWEAWTTSELLDRWWGPAPWKAVTKSFDFREGGMWLYAMTGPEGEKHWCKVTYLKIVPEESFSGRDEFCDENGVLNDELPASTWHVAFTEKDGKTHMVVTTTFESEEDMKQLVEMGVEEGFSMGLDQLEKLLTSSQ